MHPQEFIAQLQDNARILGLDFGNKKIGISISDSKKIIASPLITMERKGNKKDILQLHNIINEEFVGGIVFGYPLTLGGEESDLCKKIYKFSEELNKELNLPIYFQDERMSTMAVSRVLRETNLSWKKKAKIEDMMAASYILQTFLDLIRNNFDGNGGLGGT